MEGNVYAPSALIENALPGVQPPISLPSRLAICLRTANPPVTFSSLTRLPVMVLSFSMICVEAPVVKPALS